MDINTPNKKLDVSNYRDPSFRAFLDHLESAAGEESHHLCLFLGLYESDKREALNDIAETTGRNIERIDLNEIVEKSEEDTFRKLDRLFENYHSPESILYFENGGKLCGAYTGFTHSRVKYATPQERYFLNKVQEFKGLVIIDIPEYSDADNTIRRAARSVIKFPLPDSLLKRFFWHLKHYSLHGFDIKTKRPEAYGEVPGNF